MLSCAFCALRGKEGVFKMFSNKKAVVKLAAMLLCVVVVLSFCVYQVYLFSHDPVKTQTTLQQTVYKTINTDIIAVRDEKYITNEAVGVMVPLVENGKRVAGGDTVAVVLQNEEAASSYARKKQLESEIAYYEDLSKSTTSQTLDIAGLDKEILKNVDNYINVIDSNNLSALKDAIDKLRDSITHRQAATGTVFDFSARLNELKSELEGINTLGAGNTDIIADSAGYYVSDIDGYENKLNYAGVVNMTVEDIEAALNCTPEEAPANVMGKLIGNFDWYLLCVLETKDAAELTVGRQITISLPFSPAGEVKAYVYRINESQDGRTPVIFRVNDMNENLATLRKESAKIRIEEYSGYRVDNRAIRMVEGEKGVYILRGNIVEFRKIKVLYSEEAFSIVEKPESGQNYLKLYDEVVIEGTDLYDRKIIS